MKWFDATKTLPTGDHPFRNVLIRNAEGRIDLGRYNGRDIVPLHPGFPGRATHWGELPESPLRFKAGRVYACSCSLYVAVIDRGYWPDGKLFLIGRFMARGATSNPSTDGIGVWDPETGRNLIFGKSRDYDLAFPPVLG